NSSVIGGNDWGGDHCQALWNIWWVPYSLFTLHKGFYYTDYLFYPIGASLTYHWLSIANTMIFLPFRLFFGVETIFNLIVFCSFFLSAFSMFLLIYYLTKNKSAAFIAGVIYGFCPWRYIHFMHINLLSMQYMPLAALFILRIYDKPNKRDAIFGAIFLFLNALSCWYYMQFFFMFFGIYVVFFAVKLWNDKKKLVSWLKHLGIMLLVFGIAIFPFVYPMIKENLTTNYLDIHRGWMTLEGADLLSFVIPSSDHLLFGEAVSPIYQNFLFGGQYDFLIIEKVNYLGITVLLISIFALIFAKFKYKFLWLINAVLFLIISMGIYLRINGAKIIKLPYYYFDYIPFMTASRWPARYSVMIVFFLAIIFSYGFKELIEKFGNKTYKILIFLGILGLILFEFMPKPMPMDSMSIPEEYNIIKDDKEEFAILEVGMRSSEIGMYWQTIHNKKILYGGVSRENPESSRFVNGENGLMKFLKEPDSISPDQEDIQEIKDFKFKYIVVAKNKINKNDFDLIKTYLDDAFDLATNSDKIFVYRVY
ncbi:hypothetical protein KY312_03360, partial [Candidatus Woesearchaeota archaeon]|nr:hypothetical protein [Candidatus Woesearchaeota archaeon]